MKLRRPNKVYYDLETTGFDNSGDQILEIAMVAVSPDWEILDVLEVQVKLRDGVIPSAGALMTNKINPYSKEWEKASITEREMFKRVKAFGERHTNEFGKPILSAFNGARFDSHFLVKGAKRSFIPSMGAFNVSSRDPWKTAKRLVDANLLKTREEYDHVRAKTYKSTKQVDIAAALGIKYEGEAHRALADVMALVQIDKKFEEIIQAAHKNNFISMPDMYDAGRTIRVVTDSNTGGKKTRHLHVLHNDLEKEFLYAIDEADINENKKFSASSVRKFAYGTIESELDVIPESAANLEALVASKKEVIDSLLKKKIEEMDENSDAGFHDYVNDIQAIRAIKDRLASAAELGAEIRKIRQELQARDIDTKSIIEAFTRANDLQTSSGGRAFFRNTPKEFKKVEFKVGDSNISILPSPIGFYQVDIIKSLANGKTSTEKKKIWTEGELAKHLGNALDMTQKEVEEYLDQVPPMTQASAKKKKMDRFQDAKHPISMINEWDDKTAALFSDEISDDLKHGIAAIRRDIYRVYPESPQPEEALFMGVKSVDEREFESDKIEPVQRIEFNNKVAVETQVAKAVSQGSVPAAPAPKIAKTTSVKCAVCGRPIKSEKALIYVMGDKCRARLMIYESGLENPQNAQVEKWGKLTDKVTTEGGIFLIKNQAGQIGVFSVNNQVKIPGKVRLIDRKQLTDSLNHGFSLTESLEISTRDIEKKNIVGVSRIDVGPDAHKSKALAKLTEKEVNRAVSKLPEAYSQAFDEIKATYSKAVEQRGRGNENSVENLRQHAINKVAGIAADLIEKNSYKAIKVEFDNMVLNMNEHLFYDKEDLTKLVELIDNGKNIDSQYLRMKTSKDKVLVFPNLKYRGYSEGKIGYGKPADIHDDPFGPWDKEYGVSAKRMQVLHRRAINVEIHTSSPRIIDRMYEDHIPQSATIYMYLRDSSDEASFGSNSRIENAAAILKERGLDVVLMVPQEDKTDGKVG